MTFHSRSVVEFGQFVTGIADSLLSGEPLAVCAELIRARFGVAAVAVRVEDRQSGGQGLVTLVEQGRSDPSWPSASCPEAATDTIAAGQDEAKLATLLRDSQHVSASVVSEGTETRYTLYLFRDFGSQGFDDEEASACGVVVSQLCRGMELSARIGASEVERSLYSSVMDRFAVGVVIIDVTGRIIRCSAAAEKALSVRDGLQLQAGRLRATCVKEDRELQAAIRAAVQGIEDGEASVSRGLSLTKLSGGRSLGVIVQPVVPANGKTGSASVAVYIRDPDANTEVESELVRQLFDLTPAEAAVARRLTSGLTLEDAAASLAISRNTARAHLRSIFSKSGITRQTELVRLMLNSAAVLGEAPRQVA